MEDDTLAQLAQLPGIPPAILQAINAHQQQVANQAQEKA
jgi:hypothetical protein